MSRTNPIIDVQTIWVFTDDGQLTKIMQETGKKLSELAAEVTIYPQKLVKIRKGQSYANKFANTGISITGKRDAATKKAAIKVLQTALNKDYGAGLDVDGIWGTNTSNALGKHYVKSGETQYMVTAAEILLLLRAYDPNGVEIPGTFGSGLLSAVKAFQKAQGLTVSGTCDRNTFLKLIS